MLSFQYDCDDAVFGGKKPTKKEIEQILKQHKLWLKSPTTEKPQGKRAIFFCANLKKVDLKMVDLGSSNLSMAHLREADLSGADLREADLSKANLNQAHLLEANLEFANLSEALLIKANLSGADLQKANLSGADLREADLSKANLNQAHLLEANLNFADLSGADLREANLSGASLIKANLSGAYLHKADLSGADLRGATLERAFLMNATLPNGVFLKDMESIPLNEANLRDADISGVDLEEVGFYLMPGGIPFIPSFGTTKNLEKLAYVDPPYSLVEIRNSLKNAGMREQERKLTYVIKHGETELKRSGEGLAALEGNLLYIFFEYTSDWGMAPMRPLQLLLKLILIFGLPYSLVVALSKPDGMGGNRREGIWVIRPRVDDRDPMDEYLKTWECIHPTFFFPQLHVLFSTRKWWWLWGIPSRTLSTLFAGLYFSVLSAFHIGWRDLNMGSWISRLQPRDFALRATGRVKFISGLQSLISVYLLALWALTYFGRPFE